MRQWATRVGVHAFGGTHGELCTLFIELAGGTAVLRARC